MIRYLQGNLLDAEADALVNTVNTVGVMGKGIALMFKERFPVNMKAYAAACKAKELHIGKMFITETHELMGPRWIVNFPTKRHWRGRSQMAWVVDGLVDLRRFIESEGVKSIAIPPLGAGNGGLPWGEVKEEIVKALDDLDGVDIQIFEPTAKYQNVAKKKGVTKLTPPRALIAELVRRYLVLGMECSHLEIQKLAWFLERVIKTQGLKDPMDLRFEALNYGPYADRLRHLLDQLDGSYLKSDKRISDADPFDPVWFNDTKREQVAAFLKSEAKEYLPALEQVSALIDGFESPYGMELLSTVDWLIERGGAVPEVSSVSERLARWPAGPHWAERKQKLFSERDIKLALERLVPQFSGAAA